MRAVTVNDVLDGHVALDIECLDRIYLNAYVPTLQTSAQVAAFLTRHLGFPFPSPALFKQLGDRFRRSVRAFADTGDIPWVTFDKHDNKLEVMRPHLARQAATGRSGVAAVGVAQEFQWTAPVILEALIPGRMRSHVSTAEVSRGAARARGQDGVGDPPSGREGPG